MTTLADLTAGQAFMFVGQITSLDATGVHLSLFGPASAAGGTAMIAPDGSMTGQLTSPASQIPVQVVTEFAQVTAGDVLASDATGETMVARAVTVQPDGSYLWSAAPSGGVVYKTDGWTVIGHVNLLGMPQRGNRSGGRGREHDQVPDRPGAHRGARHHRAVAVRHRPAALLFRDEPCHH